MPDAPSHAPRGPLRLPCPGRRQVGPAATADEPRLRVSLSAQQLPRPELIIPVDRAIVPRPAVVPSGWTGHHCA